MKKFFRCLLVLACLAVSAVALAADPATAPAATAAVPGSGFAAGMSWITTNWINLIAAVGGLVTAFSVIAKLTPTPRDDAWAAKLVKWIDWLAMNTSRKQ